MLEAGLKHLSSATSSNGRIRGVNARRLSLIVRPGAMAAMRVDASAPALAVEQDRRLNQQCVLLWQCLVAHDHVIPACHTAHVCFSRHRPIRDLILPASVACPNADTCKRWERPPVEQSRRCSRPGKWSRHPGQWFAPGGVAAMPYGCRADSQPLDPPTHQPAQPICLSSHTVMKSIHKQADDSVVGVSSQ